MIPVGQPYRPAGTLDVRSILITTILGVTAAVIGAAVIWLWEWSPIPTLVIVTPIIQGLGVGAVMAFAVGRLRMRNPNLVFAVGCACGLLSIGLVHYGHYMSMVTSACGDIRGEIVRDKSIPEEKRKALLERLDADPAGFIDPMLVQATGHSGFLGSLFLRNQQGIVIKRAPVTGIFLWIIWGAEALFVVLTAAALPRATASRPFCEECGYWCEKKPDLFTLPGASAAPLVQAIRDDNASRVAELRANPPPYDESGLVGVSLHTCPGCDLSFADASHRVVKGKEMKVTNLLSQHRVSPEVLAAMRNAPVSAVAVQEDDAEPPGAEDIPDEHGQHA
jgi:hypothetical protein